MLVVDGKFALDPGNNPPLLKSIELDAQGRRVVILGDRLTLRLGHSPELLLAMLDLRVVSDPPSHAGLSTVVGGCGVFCNSNTCRDWALKNGRPRLVAKIIGVAADVPRYVLLSVPALAGSNRRRRESPSNRAEALLVPFTLIEPGEIQCPRCPGPNRGNVLVEP